MLLTRKYVIHVQELYEMFISNLLDIFISEC
jgi:hypothetical protein